MRVIGVVDLLGGQAVRARAGRREDYAPVRHAAGTSIPSGDAVALARAYRDRFGVRELYVADLDAILGRAPQPELVSALAALGMPLWLDAGVSSVERAHAAAGLGVSHVVIGLETLESFAALSQMCVALGRERIAFSLDLRNGEPIVANAAVGLRGDSPGRIAARAEAAGAGTIIVLDLSRIGMGAGIDLAVLADVRETLPKVTLLAGGGVRGADDLQELKAAGCDGALVASALLDGRLSALDVATAGEGERYPSDRR